MIRVPSISPVAGHRGPAGALLLLLWPWAAGSAAGGHPVVPVDAGAAGVRAGGGGGACAGDDPALLQTATGSAWVSWQLEASEGTAAGCAGADCPPTAQTNSMRGWCPSWSRRPGAGLVQPAGLVSAGASHWLRFPPVDFCAPLQGPGAIVVVGGEYVALANGFTCAVLDTKFPRLASLRGDFEGTGAYGGNGLSGAGVALETVDAAGTVHSSATAGGAQPVVVTSNTSQLAAVRIDGVTDGIVATASWELSLAADARSLHFKTVGSIIKGKVIAVRGVRHTFPFTPSSVYAMFDRGVVQTMGRSLMYGSADNLQRLYTLGTHNPDLHTAGNLSVSLRRSAVSGSGISGLVVVGSGQQQPESSFEEVLFAGAPANQTWLDRWTGDGVAGLPAVTTTEAQWTTRCDIAANNADFPAHGPSGDLSTDGNIAAADLRAMLTGIYGSPVGQLRTHDNGVKTGHRVGQMATTIGFPSYGYRCQYNFFDPDNYLSTAALLYSGDRYLQNQVRFVLEHNGAHINADGQLPHHFDGIRPTYKALSGMTQTGPNLFWILSCFNYAKTTGDLVWLKEYMPKLRAASAFLYNMIDGGLGLLSAPGSLMIDVFLRSDFATDTNAIAVGFFREFADAEQAVGNATGAAALRKMADGVADAVDTMLWSNASGDHYVTQLNHDGTTRDFIDYDANLIALAYGIAPPERARAVLQRIDGGRCTHGRATWVSEQYYGMDATQNGNTGDSWCAMGRIGWFDALSRKRYGDQETFDDLIINPLIDDVIRWTWMHERAGCDGSPMTNRTAYYYEFPSVTAMMVHYVRYGIQLGLLNVTISPFGPKTFRYRVGDVRVDYSAAAVNLTVPGTGVKWVTIDGLSAGAHYAWGAAGCDAAAAGTVQASGAGSIAFQAPVGDPGGPCHITATQT